MAQLKNLALFSDLQYSLERQTAGVDFQRSAVLRHSNNLYGIEVETEKWELRDVDHRNLPKYWTFTGDGSLRGELATESVSHPLKGNVLVRAVRQLCRAINYTGVNAFTYRCSTHIHLNLLDIVVDAMPSVALTALCADNFMFEAGGGTRRGNYNCRSASLLMEDVEQLAILSHQIEHSNHYEDRWHGVKLDNRHKYLGTNFAAMFKFGTVEFRHFPGTSDPKTILEWCDLIGDIYKFATTTKVDDVYLIAQEGAGAFAKAVFGEGAKSLKYAKQDEDWFETLDSATQFINTYRNQTTGRETFHGLLEAEYVI